MSVVPGSDPEHEFASRAALKLAGALDALARVPGGPRVAGAFCADLGASTGGFTDVLLRRGAAHVVAIDVGHDQLVPALRADERVTVVEGLNVRHLTPSDLAQPPDLVVADLSFISLTVVLPAVAGLLRQGAQALLMVKPQFEVGRERLGSGGVVRDPALQAEAVRTVAQAAQRTGLRVRAVVPSSLPGPSGNREYFVWLVPDTVWEPADRPTTQTGEQAGEQALAHAVELAVAWDPAQDDGSTGTGRPPEPPAVVVPEPGTTLQKNQSTQQTDEKKERQP